MKMLSMNSLKMSLLTTVLLLGAGTAASASENCTLKTPVPFPITAGTSYLSLVDQIVLESAQGTLLITENTGSRGNKNAVTRALPVDALSTFPELAAQIAVDCPEMNRKISDLNGESTSSGTRKNNPYEVECN